MSIQQRLQIETCAGSHFIARNVGRHYGWLARAEIDQQGRVAALTNQVCHEGMLVTFRIEGSDDGDG